MRIIGEKINASIGSVAAATATRDSAFIRLLAARQAAAGAHYLDINAGTFRRHEPALLAWLAAAAQDAADLPLCLDSPDPAALAQALAIVRQKPIINSITLQSTRYSQMLPLLKHYRPAVIALCLDDDGIPPDAARRFTVACRLVDRLVGDGVAPEDIFLDCVAQPIGTDSTAGRVLLDTVRAVRAGLGGVHSCCGLSNISFGLPGRRLLNQAFAAMLVACGIDTLLLDPLDERLMALLSAAAAVAGADKYCRGYLQDYRQARR